jgi:glycosyltransferase involved in cell wall biosynthesis
LRKKSIFIFAYYSFRDPVFQSAVLPYFKNFPSYEEFKFVLLTFEQPKYELSANEKKEIREDLLKHNILWYHSRWRSGSFKIFKKAYDTLSGFLYSVSLIVKHRCRLIYSEGFPGAVIAQHIASFLNRPHIVHTYEPHTDYMVEGGIWNENSWEAKWLKKAERKVGMKAYAIMTATSGFIERLRAEGIRSKCIRVPSCVDADLFQFYSESRAKIRSELNINDDQCVIIYIGKTGGMYWEEEIFGFFRSCLDVSNNFYFLFFTPEDLKKLRSYCDKYEISPDKITLGFLQREQVPHYLSAADFGLVPVKQYASKRYCSPIKDGEYWACELPLIIPEGVSDDYLFAKENEIGLTIQDDKKSFADTAQTIAEVFTEKDYYSKMRKRCRAFVLKDREIKSFQKIYLDIFNEVFNKN